MPGILSTSSKCFGTLSSIAALSSILCTISAEARESASAVCHASNSTPRYSANGFNELLATLLPFFTIDGPSPSGVHTGRSSSASGLLSMTPAGVYSRPESLRDCSRKFKSKGVY